VTDETEPAAEPVVDPLDRDPEHHPRVVRARKLYQGALVAVIAVLVVLSLLTLFYVAVGQGELRQTAEQAKSAADRIADCTTPKGECYERGQAQTKNAVNQIVTALQTLETQRGQTSTQILASQEAIKQALRELCAAQHITCPSLTPQ
jgi:uncharacterized protein HemX